MKILLLAGESGSGKTTLQSSLSENKELYNPVMSYTDRPMRNDLEYGHIFISPEQMDNLLQNENIVAETYIDGFRYCTVESQFDVHKVNIYIVDANGVYDTKEFFGDAEIITVVLLRSDIDIDDVRYNRDIEIPKGRYVDYYIHNDSSIYDAVNKVDLLARLGFFKGTARDINTLEDKYNLIESILMESIPKEFDCDV